MTSNASIEARMLRPEKDIYEELFAKVLPLVQDYLTKVDDRTTKVVDHKSPQDMKSLISAHLPEKSVLETNASDDKTNNFDFFVDQVKRVLDYSCRVSHPYFMDKMYTGTEAVGVLGESLRALLNTNIHVYSVCPVFAVLEVEIIRQLACDFVGFPLDEHDGIMCPGGAYSNMLAMVVARNILYPETKIYGYTNDKTKNLVCFTSVMAHYSIAKSASVLGFGIQNVVKVAADKNGRMIPEELEKAIQVSIQGGKTPFFINATSGTTVLGAFDPLEPIAAIAKKYNCWFHVDASWGGSLLVSQKHRAKLNGIQHANSLTWNPHKALRLPHQTTFLLVRSKTALRESNNLDAQYLFKEDPYGEADYDVGTKTLMCGRNPDILKFWLTWMYHGRQGLEYRVNKAIDNANLFVDLLKQRPEKFMLVHDAPEFSNVCFFYLTPSIRSMTPYSKEWKDALNKIAPIMYREMRKHGSFMISNSPLPDGTPFFWRIIILNEKIGQKDLEFILNEFEVVGEKL